MHQSLAINLNQETWGLLERKDRTGNDDQRMITFAKGSLYHWQRSPNCRPVNHQRGEWLISHVYAVLNRGKEALFHAEICMDITMNESLNDSAPLGGLSYRLLILCHIRGPLQCSFSKDNGWDHEKLL